MNLRSVYVFIFTLALAGLYRLCCLFVLLVTLYHRLLTMEKVTYTSILGMRPNCQWINKKLLLKTYHKCVQLLIDKLRLCISTSKCMLGHGFSWSKMIKNALFIFLCKPYVHMMKKYVFDNFRALVFVFDHMNACASMHLLVKINNIRIHPGKELAQI